MKQILLNIKNRLILLLALLSLSTGLSLAQGAKALWVNGITVSINDATLGTSLAGIIGKRPCKEGDFVKQGQVVIELDNKLEELEVARRKEVMDLKKTDLDSTRALTQKSAISVSKEELDKKISEYSVAAVEYELAKEQLRKRQIFAPFEGSITELFLQVGEACQAQQPMVRLVDTRHCYFVSNVDAKAGYALKAGQTVKLEVEAGASPVAFQGTVSFVAPVVDPASGLLKVKVVFENPEGKIRPGAAGRMLLGESK